MFARNSRYANQKVDILTLADGSPVATVRLPFPISAHVIGYHRRLDSQRLDLISSYYLTDPTTFWKLCDTNNQMVPDTLATRDLVGTPAKGT